MSPPPHPRSHSIASSSSASPVLDRSPHHTRERAIQIQTAMASLSLESFSSADSVSSPPSYTPDTPSLQFHYAPPLMMSTGAPFFLGFGFGVGGESYTPLSAEYYEEYTPASPPPRAGSPDYTPLSPPPRAGSPDYTPLSPPPRAGSPDYTPLSPPPRAVSPDYAPSSPPPRAVSPDYTPSSPPLRAWSPDYTPLSPSPRAVSPDYTPLTPSEHAASPDYTPSTPPSRVASPEYTPSTPPPSPLVSDAESRTSPAPRRHHPYQRSGASRISHSRRQRALRY